MQTTTQPIIDGDPEAPVHVSAWPPGRRDHASIYAKAIDCKPVACVSSSFTGDVKLSADRTTLEAIHAALTAALYPKE